MATTTTSQPALTPEFAIAYRELKVMSLAHELEVTKRVIKAIPEDKKNYKPHPTNRSAWELAVHIAVSEVWFLNGVAATAFAMPEGEEKAPANTVAGLISWYEKNQAEALAKVRQLTPKQLTTPTDFFATFNFPLAMYLEFALVHTVHHRGQLSAYLRPMGAKVPDIYGGSADEPFVPGK